MVVVPAVPSDGLSPADEEGRYTDEGPEHRVTIPQHFAIGVHEVTRGQFGAFVEATGYHPGDGCYIWENAAWQLKDIMSWRWPGFTQTDDQPVVCVSWDDAAAYAEWLADETLEPYRLLSEAEWEYAARAGTRTRYWWGDDIDDRRANFGNTKGGTTPVGAFAANAFGLLDVQGNAGEWVNDCYHDSYDIAGRPDDGSAWTSGDCSRRVLRGGSWFDGPRAQRSAYRDGNEPDYRVVGGGFRVGRTLR
ncbi:MAG: formylglycine-generating enzyme family protein [Geminicoccaceae bacterium]